MSNVAPWAKQMVASSRLEREVIAARQKLEEAALAYGGADTKYGYVEAQVLHAAAESFEVAHRNREQFYQSIRGK